MGVAVLLGWFLEVPRLTSLYLSGPTLKTNAALCLMCSGIANFLLICERPAETTPVD